MHHLSHIRSPSGVLRLQCGSRSGRCLAVDDRPRRIGSHALVDESHLADVWCVVVMGARVDRRVFHDRTHRDWAARKR